jgi:hypothetical protein
LIIEHQRQEFTPIHELKQIEALLQTLESKLHDFHQILPRLDPRRALLDYGGTILKTLFGAATISDINSFHDVINDLQVKNLDISHSLSSQLTYVKDLSTTTKINSEAITNLSSVIKDNIIQFHEQFQRVTRDLLWLNITLHQQNTLYSTIKQMEITLVQLTQQIDDLFDAVQYAIQGRLPIKLVNPVALQNILRNVTLKLPEGYELIAGTSLDTIHLYYYLVSVCCSKHLSY